MKPKKKVTKPKAKPVKKVVSKKATIKPSTKVKDIKLMVKRVLDKSVKAKKAEEKKKLSLTPQDLKMIALIGKCYKIVLKDKKTKKIIDEKYIKLLSWHTKLKHFHTTTLTKLYGRKLFSNVLVELDQFYIMADHYETLPKGCKLISEDEYNKQIRLFVKHLDIPSEGRTFRIDAKEEAKFDKWVKKTKVKHEHAGAAGGAYEWKFIPTGLGTLVEVEDIKGNKLKLRGTENW